VNYRVVYYLVEDRALGGFSHPVRVELVGGRHTPHTIYLYIRMCVYYIYTRIYNIYIIYIYYTSYIYKFDVIARGEGLRGDEAHRCVMCACDCRSHQEEPFLTEDGALALQATLDEFVQSWPGLERRIEKMGWRQGMVTPALLKGRAPSGQGA
jgi:hypothetical protein